MSAVITVCTSKYKLMMADSRICIFDSNNSTPKISDQSIRKYRVMNNNVCIGASGDIWGLQLISSLPKDKYYSIEDYAKMIMNFKNELKKCYLSTIFILVGFDNKGQNSIITLSSRNHFQIDKITPTNEGERAYRVALPFMTDDLHSEFMKKIDLVVGNSFSNVIMERDLKDVILEMSKVDVTIDDKIRMWSNIS